MFKKHTNQYKRQELHRVFNVQRHDYNKVIIIDQEDLIMQVNIKKLNPDAVVPSYAKAGDAGMDLTAISKGIEPDGNVVYGTGLAIEIPEGHVGLLFPRSSLTKYNLSLGNHVGVIDSGYRGEILFKFKQLKPDSAIKYKDYQIGDRIGQILILPYPEVKFVEVEELSSTERGSGGYGSSGS